MAAESAQEPFDGPARLSCGPNDDLDTLAHDTKESGLDGLDVDLKVGLKDALAQALANDDHGDSQAAAKEDAGNFKSACSPCRDVQAPAPDTHRELIDELQMSVRFGVDAEGNVRVRVRAHLPGGSPPPPPLRALLQPPPPPPPYPPPPPPPRVHLEA